MEYCTQTGYPTEPTEAVEGPPEDLLTEYEIALSDGIYRTRFAEIDDVAAMEYAIEQFPSWQFRVFRVATGQSVGTSQ